ncbi:hypothetical protein GOODEAATRI_009150 [Goodea atripinnis]|uniref:Uncharacterized protein n=1 Tax=Goodea atripinnis TaxID=208336 RepID=A0ABV0MZW6_9TELE
MVTNVLGRQVGHIKKELAAAMAYVMDQNLAKVEGLWPLLCCLIRNKRCPGCAHGKIKMRCHLSGRSVVSCTTTASRVSPPKKYQRGSGGEYWLMTWDWTGKATNPGSNKEKHKPTKRKPSKGASPLNFDQFEQHVHSNMKLNIYLYYGSERNRNKTFLSSQDVVITTYNVLSTDFGAKQREGLVDAAGLPAPEALRCEGVVEQSDPETGHTRRQDRPAEGEVIEFRHLIMCYRNLQNLVKCITLRRTKNSEVNGRRLVSLPKKSVYVEKVVLSQQEREEYELARNEGRRIIGG